MLCSYLGAGRPYYNLKPSGSGAAAEDGAPPDAGVIDNPDQRCDA